MSNVGTCVGGPIAGAIHSSADTTHTQYRQADHLNLDGGGKTYNRVIGFYTFAAGSWTWTAVNQP